MNWPVILSGVVCVTMLALGFNLLLPLGSGLGTVCVLIAVASARAYSSINSCAIEEISVSTLL